MRHVFKNPDLGNKYCYLDPTSDQTDLFEMNLLLVLDDLEKIDFNPY